MGVCDDIDARLPALDALPLPAFAIDAEGTVTDWNLALEARSGLRRERTVGRPLVELFPGLAGTPLLAVARRIARSAEHRGGCHAVVRGGFDSGAPRDAVLRLELRRIETQRGARVMASVADATAELRERRAARRVRAQLLAAAEANLRPAGPAGRVLLLEPDPALRAALTELVAARGLDAVASGNRVDFLRAAARMPHDLALVPLAELAADHFELARELASAGALSFAVLCDAAAAEERRSAAAAGALDCTLRPLRAECLDDLLAAADAVRGADREPAYETVSARLAELGLAEEPEVLRETLGEFIASLELLLRQLGTAVRSGDVALRKAAAHRLAGAAMNIGAEPLGQIARDLELAAADEEPQRIRQLRALLDSDGRRVLGACRLLLLGRKSPASSR